MEVGRPREAEDPDSEADWSATGSSMEQDSDKPLAPKSRIQRVAPGTWNAMIRILAIMPFLTRSS